MMSRNALALLAVLAACFLAGHAQADEAAHPVLSWTSHTENGVYGYIIYRARSEAGPFRRVNPRLVMRAGDANASAGTANKYRYVDTSAEAGQTYYYYIDAVADSGRKQRLTGIVRKATGGG